MTKSKVIIIDDSAIVRKVLGSIISQDPALELVGVAQDPLYALRYMEKSWPDVIILDVEMPRMDGITFLKKIMAEHPTPVVICSTLTTKNAETTMQALTWGAVDVIEKPKLGIKGFIEESTRSILTVIKSAAKANVKRLHRADTPLIKSSPKFTADAVLSYANPKAMAATTDKVVAIGSSTGGTNALECILTALPKTSPGILIVQHMPERFTAAFAARLNGICQVEVKEAAANDAVMLGRVLIAPGGKHMLLKRSGAKYYVDVVDGPLVSRHRPSVDVLFRSVAQTAGNNALGIIMTGMGDDGASGLLEMKQAGAHTVAQDEASCIVYGMPKEAVKRGAVDKEVTLVDIAKEIIRFYEK